MNKWSAIEISLLSRRLVTRCQVISLLTSVSKDYFEIWIVILLILSLYKYVYESWNNAIFYKYFLHILKVFHMNFMYILYVFHMHFICISQVFLRILYVLYVLYTFLYISYILLHFICVLCVFPMYFIIVLVEDRNGNTLS